MPQQISYISAGQKRAAIGNMQRQFSHPPQQLVFLVVKSLLLKLFILLHIFYIVVSLFFLLILCHKEKCLGMHLPYISILRKYSFSKIFYHLFLKIKSFSKSFFFQMSFVFKSSQNKTFLHVSLSSKKKSKENFLFKKRGNPKP